MIYKKIMVPENLALPGRDTTMPVAEKHFVLPHSTIEPLPEGYQKIQFGMGCFWGAEKLFWQQQGVYSTAVGYSGGFTPNPNYAEVCTGMTGHNEVVLVYYDPDQVAFERLLAVFWQGHNPTQGMRQGNDVGTQYRSAIYYYTEAQQQLAQQSLQHYQQQIAHIGQITTEIKPAGVFYYAEDEHQQYLAKNPSGYCGLGGLGVSLSMD